MANNLFGPWGVPPMVADFWGLYPYMESSPKPAAVCRLVNTETGETVEIPPGGSDIMYPDEMRTANERLHTAGSPLRWELA